MRRVIKRDGTYQEFTPRKIKQAILMAYQEVQPDSIPNIQPLVKNIVDDLPESDLGVEDIQDAVEQWLMRSNSDVAKAYILYREERRKARDARSRPDPSWVADYIHVSKYSRYRDDLGRRETRDETILRTEDMFVRKFPELEKKIRGAFKYVHDGYVLASQRAMQFGGKAAEVNNARIYNCSFTLVDRLRVFQEIFWLLLSGSGVGYSVQWRHVEQLPILATINEDKVKHFAIPDTIEGWADAVGELFLAYTEGYHVEFAYHQLRDKGTRLKTSGGRAPGHLPLKNCLEQVRKILHNAQGRKLRPIECHDIICFIAEAVLSGGIRRSALMCLFSPEDTEMLYCKARGQFQPGKVNAQREMANNAAIFLRATVTREMFDRVIAVSEGGFGDPGFFFTDNLDFGCNPCAEIGMYPVLKKLIEGVIKKLTGFSFCNLTSVVIGRCKSREEFYAACEAASIIGTLQAAMTDFPYLTDVTKEIVERDALLGVSLSAMADNIELSTNSKVLKHGAKVVIETNREWAKRLGINTCARGTTVKPEGTSSLWLGCLGSGVHARYARRYFRRITANSNEPAAQYFRSVNPHAVEVKPNGDWSLVFPVESPSNALTVKEESAMEFLKRVFQAYEYWVLPGTGRPDVSEGLTHNVSCTVTLKPDELKEVQDTVWNNRHRISAMSFSPYLLDKFFPFAPNEEAHDEKRWNELISLWKPVDWTKFKEEEDNTSPVDTSACEGAACAVR